MKKKFAAFVLCVICLLSAAGCGQTKTDEQTPPAADQSTTTDDYLTGIGGTYVELFPELSKSEYRNIWIDATAPLVGAENAEATTDLLLGMCMAEPYGPEAAEKYEADPDSMAFNCYFLGGIDKFVMDGHTITCSRKSDVDLGYVGNVEKVDTTLIEHLLNDGFIPVIATVGMDENGIAYNINADTAAAAIAIALHAEKFVSMTDIVGLLYDKDDESTLIPEVEISEIEGYKAHGVISGGMIPKIEGMADAIYEGVHEAVIIDGRVPHSVLLEMFSDRGSGTLFYRRGNR